MCSAPSGTRRARASWPSTSLVSAQRALSGLLVGGSIGFLLGLANGVSKLSHALTDTTLQMIRTIPNLALIPLVILWFGIGEEAKLFLTALGVFFPIYLNTLHGVRNVDPQLIEMGRVYGMSGWTLFRKVIFPGALPSIFVGLRFSLGIMWLTLIVAETMAASSGIGHMANTAREFMMTDVVVLALVIYALLGKLADVDRAVPRSGGRCNGTRPSRSRRRAEPMSQISNAVRAHHCLGQGDRARISRRPGSPPATRGRGVGIRIEGLDKSSATCRCCAASTSRCRPGSSSPSSARAVAARARCCGCWSGSTSRPAGASASSMPGGDRSSRTARIVFQEPRLLPWASVAGNVAVGLGDGVGRREAHARSRWRRSPRCSSTEKARRMAGAAFGRAAAARGAGARAGQPAGLPRAGRAARRARCADPHHHAGAGRAGLAGAGVYRAVRHARCRARRWRWPTG